MIDRIIIGGSGKELSLPIEPESVDFPKIDSDRVNKIPSDILQALTKLYFRYENADSRFEYKQEKTSLELTEGEMYERFKQALMEWKLFPSKAKVKKITLQLTPASHGQFWCDGDVEFQFNESDFPSLQAADHEYQRAFRAKGLNALLQRFRLQEVDNRTALTPFSWVLDQGIRFRLAINVQLPTDRTPIPKIWCQLLRLEQSVNNVVSEESVDQSLVHWVNSVPEFDQDLIPDLRSDLLKVQVDQWKPIVDRIHAINQVRGNQEGKSKDEALLLFSDVILPAFANQLELPSNLPQLPAGGRRHRG